ncbi:hypothetical protein ACS0TY_016335 [Phlomoides rotata]
MPTSSVMGHARQRTHGRHPSFAELINERLENSKVLDDPFDLQYSKDILVNYARKLDSLYANQRVNPRSSYPERLDGMLLEPHSRHGARRNMPSAAESASSSYHSQGNIPNFRKMKEYPGDEGTEGSSCRTKSSYYDMVYSKPISIGTRKLARKITRQIEDACVYSEDEMYPGFRGYMGDMTLSGAHRNGLNREQEMFKWSSRHSPVDDNKWCIHLSSRPVNRDENRKLLGSLMITRIFRDLELVEDPRTLREVIAIPDGATSSNNFAYRSSHRSRSRLGTDSRSSVFGATSRSGPWNEVQRASSSLRSLPPTAGTVHRRERRSQMAENDDGGDPTDLMTDKHEITTLPSEPSTDDQEDFSVQGLHHGPPEEGSPSLHQLGAESSSESSRKAYPNSASSCSESFERVSADLNELRKNQLLLKLESSACDEISTLISNEEDSDYPSLSAERWEVSYTLNVLTQSGFHDFGFDMFKVMWDYPDHPLNPALFDTLETKYVDDMLELRSERLLLFHRINSALLQAFQKHVDLRTWMMPKLGKQVKEGEKDAVEGLISSESTHQQIVERVVVLMDMQPGDPLEEVAPIIEELVLDDMIIEFLSELVCNMGIRRS